MQFVYRHYPFLGTESFRSAQASECADEQGAFWEYHDKLIEEWQGENAGAFSDANLVRFAGEIGLDSPSFDECLVSERYADKVSEQRDSASSIGVSSTPTVFVDGERVNATYAELKVAIEGALAGE